MTINFVIITHIAGVEWVSTFYLLVWSDNTNEKYAFCYVDTDNEAVREKFYEVYLTKIAVYVVKQPGELPIQGDIPKNVVCFKIPESVYQRIAGGTLLYHT